jgi:hypothetical protein
VALWNRFNASRNASYLTWPRYKPLMKWPLQRAEAHWRNALNRPVSAAASKGGDLLARLKAKKHATQY